VGNFLISRAESGARVFSIDNGVAFAYNESDRGFLWQRMRVDRLPQDVVARLRAVDEQELERRLGVLAQWRLQDGRWVAEVPGSSLNPGRGVRQSGGVVQLGLNRSEIDRVWRLLRQLLEDVDEGRIRTY
jgi:hypothetical protein